MNFSRTEDEKTLKKGSGRLNTTNKKSLSLTYSGISDNQFLDNYSLDERTTKSPYFEPLNGFGLYPPPKPRLAYTQPSPRRKTTKVAIISPTSSISSHSPRKYQQIQKETMPYIKRKKCLDKNEHEFFARMQEKYHDTKQWNHVYSRDIYRLRQHSIERVNRELKQKQINDQKQRMRDNMKYKKAVEMEKRNERFYNDEIFCRTGKQYRYIPNYDRFATDSGYIFI